MPSRPTMDPICSNKPLPCSRICGRTARFTRKTLKTLISNCWRTCSRVNASRGPLYDTPGVVDHHIKATGRLDHRFDGLFHGRIICDIDLDEVQGKLFSLRERTEFFCRRGILSCRSTHARESTVSLTRQGFNSQTAKTTGTPSDKNCLRHARPSILSFTLRRNSHGTYR